MCACVCVMRYATNQFIVPCICSLTNFHTLHSLSVSLSQSLSLPLSVSVSLSWCSTFAPCSVPQFTAAVRMVSPVHCQKLQSLWASEGVLTAHRRQPTLRPATQVASEGERGRDRATRKTWERAGETERQGKHERERERESWQTDKERQRQRETEREMGVMGRVKGLEDQELHHSNNVCWM